MADVYETMFTACVETHLRGYDLCYVMHKHPNPSVHTRAPAHHGTPYAEPHTHVRAHVRLSFAHAVCAQSCAAMLVPSGPVLHCTRPVHRPDSLSNVARAVAFSDRRRISEMRALVSHTPSCARGERCSSEMLLGKQRRRVSSPFVCISHLSREVDFSGGGRWFDRASWGYC